MFTIRLTAVSRFVTSPAIPQCSGVWGVGRMQRVFSSTGFHRIECSILIAFGRPKIRRAEHAGVSARPVVACNHKGLLHTHPSQMARAKRGLKIESTNRSIEIENLTR
jgi:hypothetical protein